MIFTNYPRNTVELTGRRPLSISRSRSWPLLSRSLGPCILTTTNTNREGNFSPVTGHTLSPANITPQSTLRTLRTVDTTMCTQYSTTTKKGMQSVGVKFTITHFLSNLSSSIAPYRLGTQARSTHTQTAHVPLHRPWQLQKYLDRYRRRQQPLWFLNTYMRIALPTGCSHFLIMIMRLPSQPRTWTSPRKGVNCRWGGCSWPPRGMRRRCMTWFAVPDESICMWLLLGWSWQLCRWLWGCRNPEKRRQLWCNQDKVVATSTSSKDMNC